MHAGCFFKTCSKVKLFKDGLVNVRWYGVSPQHPQNPTLVYRVSILFHLQRTTRHCRERNLHVLLLLNSHLSARACLLTTGIRSFYNLTGVIYLKLNQTAIILIKYRIYKNTKYRSMIGLPKVFYSPILDHKMHSLGSISYRKLWISL